MYHRSSKKEYKKPDPCGSIIGEAEQKDIKQPMKKKSQAFSVFLRLSFSPKENQAAIPVLTLVVMVMILAMFSNVNHIGA